MATYTIKQKTVNHFVGYVYGVSIIESKEAEQGINYFYRSVRHCYTTMVVRNKMVSVVMDIESLLSLPNIRSHIPDADYYYTCSHLYYFVWSILQVYSMRN